jgi:hypothetical protein
MHELQQRLLPQQHQYRVGVLGVQPRCELRQPAGVHHRDGLAMLAVRNR